MNANYTAEQCYRGIASLLTAAEHLVEILDTARPDPANEPLKHSIADARAQLTISALSTSHYLKPARVRRTRSKARARR